MGRAKGRVREIRIGASGQAELSISCPAAVVPRAGQYLLAFDPQDAGEILGNPLFAIEMSSQGFWAAPLHPVSWHPGINIDLVGPLGHGFELPSQAQRLGLVALGETISRLMPLVYQATPAYSGITLFTDLTLPRLPAALEAYPLDSLKDTLDWPDFLALDVPLPRLSELRQIIGIVAGAPLPCLVQVLVTAPIPCVGLAQCGACAVPGRRGWKLVCSDGPVFDLYELKW